MQEECVGVGGGGVLKQLLPLFFQICAVIEQMAWILLFCTTGAPLGHDSCSRNVRKVGVEVPMSAGYLQYHGYKLTFVDLQESVSKMCKVACEASSVLYDLPVLSSDVCFELPDGTSYVFQGRWSPVLFNHHRTLSLIGSVWYLILIIGSIYLYTYKSRTTE